MSKMGNAKEFETVLANCGYDYTYDDILNVIIQHSFQRADELSARGWESSEEMWRIRACKLFNHLESKGYFIEK